MITLLKENDEFYPNIRISDEVKSFLIMRKNAPDPYWIPDFHPLNDNEDISFIINETDKKIYTIFNNLYTSIISGNVYSSDNDTKLNKEEIGNYKELAVQTGLIKDQTIYWHSHDSDPFVTLHRELQELALNEEKNNDNLITKKLIK